MVKPKQPASAKAAAQDEISWFVYVFVFAGLGIMIWVPSWTVEFAFVTALATEFMPSNKIVASSADGKAGLSLFGIGVACVTIEWFDWLLWYRDQVPFRDVLFPVDDTPADLRFILLGWICIFSSVFQKIRKLLTEDPKLDDPP